jgi:Flp pilus assembly protein TadG
MARRLSARRDDGSAVVEFVLVLPLLLLVAVAILQLLLALHVRSTLISAAAEGARAAALAGAAPDAGVARTRALLGDTLAGTVVLDIAARPSRVDGLDVMVVTVDATLPLVGLLGPTRMTVAGTALREGWT